jgi:hypothetical protein
MTGSDKIGVPLDFKAKLDIIGISAHSVEKLALARSLVIRHSRLDKMTRAIKLVLISVLKSALRLNDREINVKIAVLALIFYNEINGIVADPLKLGAILGAKNI